MRDAPTTIAFIDTETTSLHPLRRAWDIAVILRRPGKPDRPMTWFVAVEDLAMNYADPFALAVGNFYTRHPEVNPEAPPAGSSRFGLRNDVTREDAALRALERVTRGALLVGANTAFDVETLDRRMRANALLSSWHYSPHDVKGLARGWLRGLARSPEPFPDLGASTETYARALGIDVEKFDKHTALGDAKLARAMWNIIEGEPDWNWQEAA